MPTWSKDDFDNPNEDYWRKFAAQHSGGASIKAAPPRSAWDTFMDSVHNAMSAAGGGMNAIFTRGNEAAREDELIRQYASDHNLSPQHIDDTIRQNRQQRASAVRETRASDELRMENEQHHRSGVGKVAAKAAEIAGSVVGDVNPTYALGAGVSALERIMGMGAIAGANDMIGQGDEVRQGIRDKGDPYQTMESIAGGAGLQGLGEGVAKGVGAVLHKAKLIDIAHGLLKRGLTPEQARGVAAGVVAESAGKVNARNPDSGAMGYGQWLGSRKAELIRRYGPHPTHDQQLDFLVHELRGGDKGGPKVLAHNDQKKVLDSYIKDFMRPAKGHETTSDLHRGSEALGETGPEDLGQPSIVADEQPSVSVQEDVNNELAKLQDAVPHEPFDPGHYEDGDLPMDSPEFARWHKATYGGPRDATNDITITPEDRAWHKALIDPNSEGPADLGSLHDQHLSQMEQLDADLEAGKINWMEYDAKLKEIADANPNPPSAEIHDLEGVRRAKDYVEASNVIDTMYDKTQRLNEAVVEHGLTVDPKVVEDTRAKINAELQNYEPGSPEHNKLLEIDEMLKEITGYSGGKPRVYGPEATEKFMTGEPKTDAANQRFPVYDSPKPGKTLHEYTDEEWRNLGPMHKKALIDEANDKLFYPEREPPAASKSFGTSRPEGINRKPPTKAPEGHDDKPVLKSEKKLLLDRLGDALEQGKPIRREAEEAIRVERARRMAAAMKARAKKGGEEGFYAELASLKGEMGRPKIESIRDWFTPAERDTLYDIVKNSPELHGYDSITAQKALNKLLGKEYGEIPTPREIGLLAKAMPQKAKIWKQLLENESGSVSLPDGTLKTLAVNVAGLPRTLKASFDFSAPFRQGMFLVGRKEFWKAMPGMFKAFFDEGAFTKIQDEIYNRPTYHLMNKAGLETTRNNAGLVDREEAFISQFAEKIPGVRHSERAYLAFLNKLRADVFDDFVRKGEQMYKWEKVSPLRRRKVADPIDFVQNPEYLKSAARFINSATGRGNLNAVTRDARVLTNVLFSPKLMKSRIDMLNPGFYVGLHPKVRKEAAKSGLIYTATVGMIASLAAGAGADIETDVRSSDFMKIKIGNTRLDITGGFQPYVRFYSQFLTGQQKSITDGVVKNIGWSPTQKLWKGVKQGPFKPTTRKDVLYRFFENKESPNMGEITRLLQGTDAVGRPLGSDPNPIVDGYAKAAGVTVNKAVNEIVGMFTPLIIADTYQAYLDLGAKGLLTAIPNAGGVGVQSYTPKKKTASWNKSEFGGASWSKKDFQ